MAEDAVRIAIVGAESTGKTTLAAALAPRLAAESRLRVDWVPELLREWCERMGRTPRAHEQAGLLEAQAERIEQAASVNDVVVCDAPGLMIAVYSRLIFDDRSLEARAAALHRRMALTLLTALDLPWVADRHLRDGPHVREPVDTVLREMLGSHRLPWSLVAGSGPARLENAVDAVAPLLRPRVHSGSGLFTRLAQRDAEQDRLSQRWQGCDCDDPDCERRLR